MYKLNEGGKTEHVAVKKYALRHFPYLCQLIVENQRIISYPFVNFFIVMSSQSVKS